MAKKQVIVIHGGSSFGQYEDYINYLKTCDLTLESMKSGKGGWKNSLQKDLGDDFEVLLPQMPNPRNAKYLEWRLWFERILGVLDKEIILIGHSLGGMFLLKYLEESKIDKKIVQLHLVATPCNEPEKHYLQEFGLPGSFDNVKKQTAKIFFYFSEDDAIVPIETVNFFKVKFSEAEFVLFSDRGHFKQAVFPELIKNIKE